MQKTLLDTVFSPVKIFCHDRMWNWKQREDIYPITMEIGISGPGNCNNKCNFCMHSRYYGTKAQMDFERYNELIIELKQLGIKGMIYSASGECTVHEKFVDFLEVTKENDIDIAVVTNGTYLKDVVEPIIETVSWIRISLDAGTNETRQIIHGVDDFQSVLTNLSFLAIYKEKQKSNCQIGAQMVVTKNNWLEIPLAVEKAKQTEIDYFQIKPVIYHVIDGRKQMPSKFIQKIIKIAEVAEKEFENERFKIYIKYDQFEALMQPEYDRNAYDKCRAIFFPIIEATGKVYHCSQTRGMKEFEIGDIFENTFQEIWHSEKRQNVLASINVKKCTPICRCHWMNKMLKTIDLKENVPAFV